MDNLNDVNSKDYWESRLTNQFDLQGVGYLSLGKCYNKWLYKIRKSVFVRLIRKLQLDIDKKRILDIGSGTGFYIQCWEDFGIKDISGIDITFCVVKNLSRIYPNYKFHQLDISADDLTPLKYNNYDALSAFDVLFHIIDDNEYRNAIKNIYFLLKPNGIFIFSENFVHEEKISAPHQVSRTLSTIKTMLINEGFEIIDRSPMFFWMNEPVDTNIKLLKLIWRINVYIISRIDSLGCLIGSLLYPIDMLLINIMKESPTTEIMICRKPQ